MEKNIQMNILNESGTYDILYPQTTSNQVIGMPTSLPANGGNAATVGGQTPQQIIATAVSQSAKIQTGSYVGTDLYGINNKNTIIFNFVPKVIFIGYPFEQHGCTFLGFWSYGNSGMASEVGNQNEEYQCFAQLSGTTFTWCSTWSEANQFNKGGWTYFYIGIG